MAEADGFSGLTDGIGEEQEPAKCAPQLVNFYQDRVLLSLSNSCTSYCRFCFRRRKVGDTLNEGAEIDVDKALEYIRRNTAIREVIVSGGDPLVLSDKKLQRVLCQLKSIPHVKVLRVDTKALVTLPQRVTPDLIEVLAAHKPIYVVGNFLHPAELTQETLKACARLVDAGIPVVAHTALLKGVNDDPEVIADLMWCMVENRVLPYYLIQFIPIKWTEHFRVPVEKGIEIMDRLHGRLSGLANPTYIVYLPDGKGKVPLLPCYLLRRTSEGYWFRNYEGEEVLYREPKQDPTQTTLGDL